MWAHEEEMFTARADQKAALETAAAAALEDLRVRLEGEKEALANRKVWLAKVSLW